MHLEDRLREQRKADRQAGSDTRPPQRSGRALHFLFAHSADDFIDQRGRKARALLDSLRFPFSDPFRFLCTAATRLFRAHLTVVSRTAIASAGRNPLKGTVSIPFITVGPVLRSAPIR